MRTAEREVVPVPGVLVLVPPCADADIEAAPDITSMHAVTLARYAGERYELQVHI